MKRVVAVLVVIGIAVFAIRALVRDEVRPERAGTSDAASAKDMVSPSDAELAAPHDAGLRGGVSPTADAGVAVETVVVDEAAPVTAEQRATTGGLEGRVLFDGGITAADLRVSVERIATSSEVVSGEVRLEALRDDGTFRFSRLEVGTYRTSVVGRPDFAFEPLSLPVDADVHAGSLTRVADIDLRGALFARELTVTDENGAPLASASGTFSGTNSAENNDIEVQDGRARIVTKHRSVDVWLGAEGRCCVGVHDVDGPRTVVLAPGLPVNVRLLDPTVLASDIAVTVRLRSGRGAINWVLGEISSSATVELDADGRAVVLAPAEWTYSVDVSLRTRSGGSSQRITFEPPLTVEVAEQLGAPFVDVPLTREQVAAARVVR